MFNVLVRQQDIYSYLFNILRPPFPNSGKLLYTLRCIFNAVAVCSKCRRSLFTSVSIIDVTLWIPLGFRRYALLPHDRLVVF
jgi:hypothetical protein